MLSHETLETNRHQLAEKLLGLYSINGVGIASVDNKNERIRYCLFVASERDLTKGERQEVRDVVEKQLKKPIAAEDIKFETVGQARAVSRQELSR